MNNPYPEVCECEAPTKFFQVNGKRRCQTCLGWEAQPKQAAAQSVACPNCGSTAAPWESRWGSKCSKCGHVALKDVDASSLTHVAQPAPKAPLVEAAWPAQAAPTNKFSMSI
jgi:ribosomal protein S27AE